MLQRLSTSALRASRIRSFSNLVQTKALVNGSWIESKNRDTFAVCNPANGQVIGNVPNMTVEDAQLAICAAKDAFESKEWRSLTVKDRSNLLKVCNGYVIYIHDKGAYDLSFTEMAQADRAALTGNC